MNNNVFAKRATNKSTGKNSGIQLGLQFSTYRRNNGRIYEENGSCDVRPNSPGSSYLTHFIPAGKNTSYNSSFEATSPHHSQH